MESNPKGPCRLSFTCAGVAARHTVHERTISGVTMMTDHTRVFIHGLDSSSRGTKGTFFRGRYPEMLMEDFSGPLEATDGAADGKPRREEQPHPRRFELRGAYGRAVCLPTGDPRPEAHPPRPGPRPRRFQPLVPDAAADARGTLPRAARHRRPPGTDPSGRRAALSKPGEPPRRRRSRPPPDFPEAGLGPAPGDRSD